MTYEELTDNQKAGIDHNAAHNLRTTNAYIAWRTDQGTDLEQDGDRGYKELTDMITAGIPLPEPVIEEPTPEWTPGEPEEEV